MSQDLLREFLALPIFHRIFVSIIPVLLAITLHEVSHGWAAKYFGDLTAERLGRLSLNPLKHIDPIGTVVVPAALLLIQAGFIFGWAKPVPVAFENLRNPKRDMALVAAAGPLSNLVMAFFWGVVLKLSLMFPGVESPYLLAAKYMGFVGIFINILLFAFNLLPLPPLDGGRVAVGLLPDKWGWYLSRIEPYGFFILIGLMLTGILWVIISPLWLGSMYILRLVLGL